MSALPPILVADRLTTVAGGLGALDGGRGVDGLLVSDRSNVRWLTGFTGSSGWAVIGGGKLVIVTDGRYGEQAASQLAAAGAHESGLDVRVDVGRTQPEITELLQRAVAGFGRLGFESAHVSYSQWRSYEDGFAPELVGTTGVIEAGRRTKQAAEIVRIERACAIADAALAEVAPEIRPGLTELDVRNLLEAAMRALGADGPSYDTIVATGPLNAPLPHHHPTATPIEDGHTVIIDVGALVDGYHSDMTRSFLVGEPSALQREVYDVVLAAQMAGVAAVRPGITTRELDAACREPIAAAGFGPWFLHGTGHGVGLLIHEDPFVNAAGAGELRVGDVVTVEPGVYRGDFGGVRVEDLVEVTGTGGRPLTRSPKDSPCLPSPPTT